jgi:hypothetical protein
VTLTTVSPDRLSGVHDTAGLPVEHQRVDIRNLLAHVLLSELVRRHGGAGRGRRP